MSQPPQPSPAQAQQRANIKQAATQPPQSYASPTQVGIPPPTSGLPSFLQQRPSKLPDWNRQKSCYADIDKLDDAVVDMQVRANLLNPPNPQNIILYLSDDKTYSGIKVIVDTITAMTYDSFKCIAKLGKGPDQPYCQNFAHTPIENIPEDQLAALVERYVPLIKKVIDWIFLMLQNSALECNSPIKVQRLEEIYYRTGQLLFGCEGLAGKLVGETTSFNVGMGILIGFLVLVILGLISYIYRSR